MSERSGGRFARRGLFGGGIGGFILIIAIVVQIVRALAPGPAPVPCTGASPCGAPPTGGGGGTTGGGGTPATPLDLTDVTTWQSSDLGYEFDFDPSLWTIDSQSPTAVVLRSNEPGSPFFVWFSSVPAAQASPEQLMAARASDLGAKILGLARDPATVILGPQLGYLGGVGARYAGQVDSPQGPGDQVDVAIMAATDGRITAAVAVVTDHGATEEAFQQADSLVNTFLWPTESP